MIKLNTHENREAGRKIDNKDKLIVRDLIIYGFLWLPFQIVLMSTLTTNFSGMMRYFFLLWAIFGCFFSLKITPLYYMSTAVPYYIPPIPYERLSMNRLKLINYLDKNQLKYRWPCLVAVIFVAFFVIWLEISAPLKYSVFTPLDGGLGRMVVFIANPLIQKMVIALLELAGMIALGAGIGLAAALFPILLTADILLYKNWDKIIEEETPISKERYEYIMSARKSHFFSFRKLVYPPPKFDSSHAQSKPLPINSDIGKGLSEEIVREFMFHEDSKKIRERAEMFLNKAGYELIFSSPDEIKFKREWQEKSFISYVDRIYSFQISLIFREKEPNITSCTMRYRLEASGAVLTNWNRQFVNLEIEKLKEFLDSGDENVLKEFNKVIKGIKRGAEWEASLEKHPIVAMLEGLGAGGVIGGILSVFLMRYFYAHVSKEAGDIAFLVTIFSGIILGAIGGLLRNLRSRNKKGR